MRKFAMMYTKNMQKAAHFSQNLSITGFKHHYKQQLLNKLTPFLLSWLAMVQITRK